MKGEFSWMVLFQIVILGLAIPGLIGYRRFLREQIRVSEANEPKA
jgi:hypothetical protein